MNLSRSDSRPLFQQRHCPTSVQAWKCYLTHYQLMGILNQFLGLLTMLQVMLQHLCSAFLPLLKASYLWTWMSIQSYHEQSFPPQFLYWYAMMKQKSKVHVTQYCNLCPVNLLLCMLALTWNGTSALANLGDQKQLHYYRLLYQILCIC